MQLDSGLTKNGDNRTGNEPDLSPVPLSEVTDQGRQGIEGGQDIQDWV